MIAGLASTLGVVVGFGLVGEVGFVTSLAKISSFFRNI
ncbi:hypothetical protein RV03_GL003332 [Enterococcus gallinarum]|nr:hypothetical protein RV03_GL003332 [Enterococcus gallinarum]